MSGAVRNSRPDDWLALTEIYNHYVIHTPITFDVEPYTVETRRAWFEQFADTGPHRLLVLDGPEGAVGYAASMRFRVKPAYETSVETSIYVARDALGKGLGQLLYTALFDALRGEDLHRAYGAVTLPNDASIALHTRFGFRSIGLYREVGRKLGRYWDVEWFEKELD